MAAPASSRANTITTYSSYGCDFSDPRICSCCFNSRFQKWGIVINVDQLTEVDRRTGSISANLMHGQGRVKVSFKEELAAFDEATGRRLKELSAGLGQAIGNPSDRIRALFAKDYEGVLANYRETHAALARFRQRNPSESKASTQATPFASWYKKDQGRQTKDISLLLRGESAGSEASLEEAPHILKVHSAVLMRSPVLELMFNDPKWIDSAEGKIDLSAYDPKIIRKWIDFMYFGTLTLESDKEAQALFRLGMAYDLPDLCNLCRGEAQRQDLLDANPETHILATAEEVTENLARAPTPELSAHYEATLDKVSRIYEECLQPHVPA